MTSTVSSAWSASAIVASAGVYPPQEDSLLLIDALRRVIDVGGATVADLCTGSGVVGIAAAEWGAARVDAFDVSAAAVACARANAAAARAAVNVHRGSFEHAAAWGPYDVIVSNPPYVPVCPTGGHEVISSDAGPARAWDAGPDGRLVLDPLCRAAPTLLRPGGTLLVVHSEVAGIGQTLTALTAAGLLTDVVVRQRIAFGPVVSARCAWLKHTGRLAADRYDEELVVIRARKR